MPKKPQTPRKPGRPHKPTKPRAPKRPGRHGKPDPEKPGQPKPARKPPKPIAPRPRLRSGFIRIACGPLRHASSLLDCWLEHNPNAANAIASEEEPFPQSPLTAWPQWTPSMKADLRQAWRDARASHANGMASVTGTVVADPPPNQWQNVGPRLVDLAVSHLSDALVFHYCTDKLNGLDHASGQVFQLFQKHGYTVAELEATNLWDRLAATAQATGQC